MSPVAFVVNRTLVRDMEQFRRRCRAAAAGGGWEPLFFETTVAEPGLGLARDAAAAGAGLVFAVGGDGTVRACAQALAGTGIPLAIVPLGTANLIARALGVPARPGAALATGFCGHDRRIDLAAADGMTFTAMAGMGLDAEVVEGTPRLLKHRLGWAAYAMSGLSHLAGRPREFTVCLDGGPPLTRLARSVVVGNAGLLPGGFRLLPGARLDDGVLDVGILAASNVLDWMRVAQVVLAGSRNDARQLERHQARTIEIRTGGELSREVDGEIIAPGGSLTVTVQPGALVARVPGSFVAAQRGRLRSAGERRPRRVRGPDHDHAVLPGPHGLSAQPRVMRATARQCDPVPGMDSSRSCASASVRDATLRTR
jgi:YegS/Rv2252/BmrU family lipid kinase